jgi:hypothetical protein
MTEDLGNQLRTLNYFKRRKSVLVQSRPFVLNPHAVLISDEGLLFPDLLQRFFISLSECQVLSLITSKSMVLKVNICKKPKVNSLIIR